jgi:hypothetical protein
MWEAGEEGFSGWYDSLNAEIFKGIEKNLNPKCASDGKEICTVRTMYIHLAFSLILAHHFYRKHEIDVSFYFKAAGELTSEGLLLHHWNDAPPSGEALVLFFFFFPFIATFSPLTPPPPKSIIKVVGAWHFYAFASIIFP